MFRVYVCSLRYLARIAHASCYHLWPVRPYRNFPRIFDGAECSETSVYKIQTPVNYPEESINRTKILPTLNYNTPRATNVESRSPRTELATHLVKGQIVFERLGEGHCDGDDRDSERGNDYRDKCQRKLN
jgi:hypothetical protein